jgi:hypothetical protein
VVHRGIDDDAADLPGAQLLRLGWKAEEGIDLAVDKTLDRLDRRVGDPVEILDWVEPDLGGQKGQQRVRVRPQGLYPDAFSLQVGDAANAFVSEQFEAADHHTGQQRNRLADIDPSNKIRRIIRVEIDLAAGDQLR